ncbi:gluconokinase [Limimaricola hongkongensis]|uniref:Gluconokinase n=1 Tax=Limimaricola hongkongensis DSM 17492 TaxID=1122180 RepID=A0A017HE22_9RHOB|nr:gluconokinase [Limimaricola hongkongensis]EYD72772.1 Gluconokinase [Limimaricola hongkongensis DSM 17492]
MNERRGPILVMGVSGAGKSTVARGLAARLGGVYLDADDLHPEENVAAMSRGEPLTDALRWGWLDLVAEAMARTEPFAVVACSALKRAYRDRLRARLGEFPIVYLDGDYDLLRARMSIREGHYMPVSLLDSQFEALEPPSPEEGAIAVSVAPPPDEIIAEAAERLSSRLQGGPDGSGQADTTPRRTS